MKQAKTKVRIIDVTGRKWKKWESKRNEKPSEERVSESEKERDCARLDRSRDCFSCSVRDVYASTSPSLLAFSLSLSLHTPHSKNMYINAGSAKQRKRGSYTPQAYYTRGLWRRCIHENVLAREALHTESFFLSARQGEESSGRRAQD